MAKKDATTDLLAAAIFGVGIGMGIIPIFLASLLLRHNLFREVFKRMDGYWRSRGWENGERNE